MTCSVQKCSLATRTRGMCQKHYMRLIQTGTTDTNPRWNRNLSPADRVMARSVAGPNNCIVWTGATAGNGYGSVHNPGGSTKAHRITYEHFVGPIPDGLHIDHLCRNTRCVNPLHLEPVTQDENNKRRFAAEKEAQIV